MLHRFDVDTAFDQRRQLAELDYATSSRAAAQTLAYEVSLCRIR
jgi:p-hydroxybenzoate 3-monooxygenase